MDSLICWCADCRDDAVFDAVPDVRPAEYVCRRCAAAVLVTDSPVEARELTTVA